jgi:spore coat polysaccharide biosynthesis protein SpsF
MKRKPRVVLIIQARMGSTRLPGKSLMDFAGKPMLYRILERVKRCKMLDEIILAIPDTDDDKPLKKIGESIGISVYEGSENDLVERFYQASLVSNAEIVGRLPADNVTPQPEEIDRIVRHHLSLDKPGFSSNLAQVNGSGYPDGIGAEMFNFSLLKEVRKSVVNKRKREHVHLNFYDYEVDQAVDNNWCPVTTIECPTEFRRPDLVLDVNTKDQYEFMKKLYESLYPMNPEFSILDIITWYDREYASS